MSALEITPGLWRWTAPHPDWTPQEDWGERVGCALYELPEAAVLFDPVLPREDREGFLRWLDARVSGRPVSVLTTIRWHRRDRSELTERYRTGIGRARGALPEGVVPRWLRGAGEVVFWLPAAQTLIVGDRLLGVPGAGLQLCPESWLKQERVSRSGLVGLLEPLLELPIVRVLVSHGEPVLSDGAAALARAIAQAREGPARG